MTDKNDGDLELPLEPVAGTTDKYTVTLPDGNRLELTGQMPGDGGDVAFEVRRTADFESAVMEEARVMNRELDIDTDAPAIEHFPGCGLTGLLTDGQHRCALCDGPVKLCGHSAAPFEGRACDACQQRTVMPRRISILALMKRLSDASSSPFAALDARDAVIAELFRKESLQALRLEELADAAMMKTIAAAEIVAWDAGLEKAATRGSEAFDGSPWDVKPCNQLLLLDGCMAVMLLVGETVTHAIAIATGGPRVPVKVLHTQIRRGQLISRAAVTSDGAAITSHNQALRDLALKEGMFWHDMAALQRFMELEVVQRESAKLPRQATRAAARAGKPLPKVIVVRLRRVYQERETGETQVEWQHRWMVRGHWRRQWYATTREHKLIYIAPFIKGPEGKPFLPPRDVVKVVSR